MLNTAKLAECCLTVLIQMLRNSNLLQIWKNTCEYVQIFKKYIQKYLMLIPVAVLQYYLSTCTDKVYLIHIY